MASPSRLQTLGAPLLAPCPLAPCPRASGEGRIIRKERKAFSARMSRCTALSPCCVNVLVAISTKPTSTKKMSCQRPRWGWQAELVGTAVHFGCPKMGMGSFCGVTWGSLELTSRQTSTQLWQQFSCTAGCGSRSVSMSDWHWWAKAYHYYILPYASILNRNSWWFTFRSGWFVIDDLRWFSCHAVCAPSIQVNVPCCAKDQTSLHNLERTAAFRATRGKTVPR